MNAVKVDDAGRVRLPMLSPGDYYEPENIGTHDVLLHKVPPACRQLTQDEVLAALEESPIRFRSGLDDLKKAVG